MPLTDQAVFAATFCSIIVAIFSIAFVNEIHTSCITAIYLWVPGLILLNIIRIGCILKNDHTVPICSLALGWTLLGNVLIPTSYQCAPRETPFMFYLSVVYVFFVDVLMIGSMIMARCYKKPTSAVPSTSVIPVTPQPFTLTTEMYFQVSAFYDTQSKLTERQSVFWKTWLVFHGCHETPYNQEFLLDEEAKFNKLTTPSLTLTRACEEHCSDDVENNLNQKVLPTSSLESVETALNTAEIDLEAGRDDVTIADSVECEADQETQVDNSDSEKSSKCKELSCGFTCTICLSALEDQPSEHASRPSPSANPENEQDKESLIVRYPCRGCHYFHAICLKKWLKASAGRLVSDDGVFDFSKLSCPVCRAAPVRRRSVCKQTGKPVAGSKQVSDMILMRQLLSATAEASAVCTVRSLTTTGVSRGRDSRTVVDRVYVSLNGVDNV